MQGLLRKLKAFAWVPASGAVLVLLGCGAGNFNGLFPSPGPPTPPPTPVAGPTFTARVMAGATPVVGASVQFYAAGTGGNGSPATPLLSAAVKTDATGTALLPASYTCPTGASLTYLVATGGTIGGTTTSNPNLALLAAVGPCSIVSAGTVAIANEVTTVAAMYALAPFYSGGSIGASASNLTGLTNAFATAATLANVATGSSSGTTLPANGARPAPRVNSIANALNACLLQSSACGGLYGATPSGSPANTLEAVAGLVRHPAANTATIFAEAALSHAYAPALAVVPADWTMFVVYTGGGLSSPEGGLAIDSTGSVWVASFAGVSPGLGGVASKFTPTGAPVFPNGIRGSGLNSSFGVAIDTSDNVWIANEGPYTGAGVGTVSKFSSTGTSLAGLGFGLGGFNYPIGIAIDPNGTVWVPNSGNATLTLINASGMPLSGSTGYSSAFLLIPSAVAIDNNHVGWIGNQDGTGIVRVTPDGSSITNVSCCNSPQGLAVDGNDNIWVTNFYGDSVSLVANSGSVISNGGYTGAGSLYRPQGIAIDGAGNVFVANFRAPYLTVLAGANAASPGASISPATGYGADAGLTEAYGLAIDASGNVWVSTQTTASPQLPNSITKFIGLAVPVRTPIAGGVKQP